jgi:hypothetical protein
MVRQRHVDFMTQNLRLANWLPTTDTADPGEIVEVRGVSGAGKIIPTRFFAQAGSSGSVGEAPTDGKFYARSNADWSISVNEAPNDGQAWGRKNNSWQVIPPFPEAPSDGQQYARQDGAWSVVTGMPAVIDGGTF